MSTNRPDVRKCDLVIFKGETFEFEGEGLLARCLLHEYDHLTGKLLADFVGPLKRKMIKRKLAKHNSESAA